MRTLALLTVTVITAAMAPPAQAQTSAAPPAGQQQESFQRPSDALSSVTWRTRTQVSHNNLTSWRFGISAAGLRNLTFLEALSRGHAVQVTAIEGASSQRVSPRIQKNLDFNLTPDEIAAVKTWITDSGLRMLSYRADSLGADAESRRKTFEFAKALGAEVIVAPLGNTPPDELDRLATENSINVALLGRPDTVMQALEGRSRRLSFAADLARWMERGAAPTERLAAIKDRLYYVSLADRETLGANARPVMLGKGAGNLTEFFHELNRQNVRPLIMMMETTVVQTPSDLFQAVEAFEDAVQPAYGAFFTEWSRSRPAPRLDLDARSIRVGSGTQMPAHEVRRKMAASILDVPYVEPKQPRKLLVIESLHGMYHNPGIPNCNVLIDLMGKITGAWETEFSNDLNNLKYPKIKEYDAVFVNSAVNEMFPDPIVREGLSRFVREGGGLGGIHGTPWASRNWEEFAEMIGSRSAPHRVENGVMSAYDPGHPLVKSFGGKPLPFREEYYRFEHDSYNRLQWENVRVVLAVELDNPAIESRPWNGYKRPDNIYPVTWIRNYGQGRTFYCSLGHMAETFMTPEISGHLFSGIQFLLGDLEVDATPNPRPPGAAARN